jgi:hypothetical protein
MATSAAAAGSAYPHDTHIMRTGSPSMLCEPTVSVAKTPTGLNRRWLADLHEFLRRAGFCWKPI